MTGYQPDFSNPYVVQLGRDRGLLTGRDSYESLFARVAKTLSSVYPELANGRDVRFFNHLIAAMNEGRIIPSSQLLAMAGKGHSVAACTVLRFDGTSDSERTRSAIAKATVASWAGMGCGIDLSDSDDPVAVVNDVNSAVHQVSKSLAEQSMRPPALMVTLAASHPRVQEFIDAKADADFNEWVANISVRVNSDDELERVLPHLAAAAHRTGEPGVLFQDLADQDNPTPQFSLTSTAPCAEVFLADNERCVFMSVNLAAHIRNGRFDIPSFEDSISLAVRAADAAVSIAAEGADPIVSARRRIGVGICGLHSALIYLRIPYAQARSFVESVAERLLFAAHSASAELAQQVGAFPLWEGSRWRNADWLDRKRDKRSGVVSDSEWGALHGQILRTGIRNANVVAFPPTGIVSEILRVSKSYEPHFTLAGRTRASATSALQIAPEVAEVLDREVGGDTSLRSILDPASGHQLSGAEPDHLLACARQLPTSVHLAVHAIFCGLADESGSKTVNLAADCTVSDVACLIREARSLGLKGLTVFRDKCLESRGHQKERDAA